MLTTQLGRRSLRELLYPTYVKLYPYLYFMRTFRFSGKSYRYFFHPYGATLRSERLIEVAIVLETLKRHAVQRVLEVGNVLSHYIHCAHDVVDKYEAARGVMNVDILEFCPSDLYDLIISISTVEHIGWNEYENQPEKAVQALEHMKQLLRPGGMMLVTMPWGTNPALDDQLSNGNSVFDELQYMKRLSARNTWRQTTAAALKDTRYGSPYPFANVLVVGSCGKPW